MAVALAVTATVQVGWFELQAPVQLTNRKPGSGAAVNVTEVLLATVAEQVLPQLIPPTLLATPNRHWAQRLGERPRA